MIDRRQFSKSVLLAMASAVVGGPGFARELVASENFVSTVLVDVESGATIHREGPAERRFTPCSTFKLPLAVMGFDSGILMDPHHPRWDYRPEFQTTMELQKKPTDPTIWLAESIVWYSQELTRKLGEARFRDYVTAFGYGNEDISGNPGKNDGLTQSWLMSSLAISPDEQVAFVRRFLGRKLGVSDHAYDATLASLAHYPAEGRWTLHGKTGSGFIRDANGAIDRSKPLGWFVGWGEKGGRRIAFARFNQANVRSETYGGLIAREAMVKDFTKLAEG
ncbi:class D beta-lactamase [Kaistia algarum]|uniref:class D beta-lactamase n=1 Tax=Kaistia algarum TaxID=2083279 RepID=UPI000CE925C2|nr:class D beta-lactamase [Kaistia algarum]MCX5516147.1 class D beta-lactamase [Kaistia algarum]PPE78221.1 class D beta-lactamase [Kaistia algarum]